MTVRPLDAARDGLIAAQAQPIVVLAGRNSALEARIERDGEYRLARLERAVSRNWGNSWRMPPSADDLPGKTAPQPRKSRGGREGMQGKQPGAHLAWSKDPDETVPLFPQGTCGWRGRRSICIMVVMQIDLHRSRCQEHLPTWFARAGHPDADPEVLARLLAEEARLA